MTGLLDEQSEPNDPQQHPKLMGSSVMLGVAVTLMEAVPVGDKLKEAVLVGDKLKEAVILDVMLGEPLKDGLALGLIDAVAVPEGETEGDTVADLVTVGVLVGVLEAAAAVGRAEHTDGTVLTRGRGEMMTAPKPLKLAVNSTDTIGFQSAGIVVGMMKSITTYTRPAAKRLFLLLFMRM